METLKKSPSTLKRQGSNMPSMPKPVMKRQGSSMEARAQIRVLKKQDTRSQLIAAAEQREKLVKAKSMARILTNEDTQVFAAGKLMKTLSSRFSPGLNEESQKEASARRTHNTKNHINHAKYQVEKKPTPLKKLVKKLEKKFKKPLKLLARLRKALQTLTQRPAFTVTIIGTVLLSCVVLALNAPYALYMTPRLSNTLDVLEILCTSIFTLESVIFLIADGPSHYLRSGPHVFELVIVIGCWVDIICKLEKLNFRYSSMLAMLRALRPLAALQIVPSMKLVLTGLRTRCSVWARWPSSSCSSSSSPGWPACSYSQPTAATAASSTVPTPRCSMPRASLSSAPPSSSETSSTSAAWTR